MLWHSTAPQCGEDMEVAATHGSIQSPGFPAQYPHNRDCVWTLRTMPGKRIQFLFATMKLETHTNCTFDYLEIFNGDAVEGIDIFSANYHLSKKKPTFCNSRIPSSQKLKKNNVHYW